MPLASFFYRLYMCACENKKGAIHPPTVCFCVVSLIFFSKKNIFVVKKY